MNKQFVQQNFERFYSSGIGYFPFSDIVTIPEYYSGVTTGTVDGACEDRHEETLYRIRVDLPEGHCDAYDENGEPQSTKYVTIRQSELSKLNPCETQKEKAL